MPASVEDLQDGPARPSRPKTSNVLHLFGLHLCNTSSSNKRPRFGQTDLTATGHRDITLEASHPRGMLAEPNVVSNKLPIAWSLPDRGGEYYNTEQCLMLGNGGSGKQSNATDWVRLSDWDLTPSGGSTVRLVRASSRQLLCVSPRRDETGVMSVPQDGELVVLRLSVVAYK